MPRYLGLRGTKLNIAVGVIAGMDFLLFGYDQGVMGGLLTLPSFLHQFPKLNVDDSLPKKERDHATVIQGISVGSYNVGCFFGAICCMWVGNILGRKKTIAMGTTIMIVGASLMASAHSLEQFIVGRIICGLGNGFNTSTVPTWQSETSKAHRRGQMVMIEGALITGGICISYWLDLGFSYLEPSEISWRFPIAFQLIFCVIILAFIFFLPESPRWLILKGYEEEAMSVLGALSDLPADDPFIQGEFTAIKDTVLEAASAGLKDLFTMDKDRHFHRVMLAYINQVFQQISGINLITYYAGVIYERYIGIPAQTARFLAAGNGTEYFAASWIAVFTVEKFGRRQLMLFGAAGMSLSMVVLAATTSHPTHAGGIVACAFLFLFNTFFAIGWLGMTWLYPAEIVPLRIRAPANAFSTSANWAFNFMVVMITPIAFNSIGYKTYIIFAVINAFIFPVVYFFYPETAYRSLEEMDSIFHKTTSIFNCVRIAREEPRRYGKNGELLINYEETDDFRANAERRRSSVVSQASAAEKARRRDLDQSGGRGKANEAYKMEGGFATSDNE